MVRAMLYFLYLSGSGRIVPFLCFLFPVYPRLSLLTERVLKRDTRALGECAGCFGVEGIFGSRMPHTGVTGGVGLDKALVFSRRTPFLR